MAEIPSLENADRPTVMREYSDIVSEHRLIYQKTESYKKAAYDRARDDLDDRMKSLLDSIENRFCPVIYAKKREDIIIPVTP